MNSIKIFLRTDQLTKDGFHIVYARLICRRRKKDVSLRILVKPDDWSFQRNLVKKSDPDNIRKNRLIKMFKNKAENIVDEYFFENKELTFDAFEKKLLNKDYSDESFYEFVLDEIPKRDYSKETTRQCVGQITKLKKFRKKLLFSEINSDFVRSYKSYMANTLKNNLNTLNKSLSRLKTFVNWAIEQRYMKENPFSNIKIQKVDGKREELNIFELKRLENLYSTKEMNYRQLNVLRYFLFVCYTGLRYSDIKNLSYNNFKKRNIEGEEVHFINIVMEKTKNEVSIPLINKASALIPKKITNNQKVFRVLSNQKTNQYLKEIMKIAGIDKNITFHCARHTLATTGLDMGIPIEVVSKILGHSEIKVTQLYAKVRDNLKYKEMLKLDKKNDENAA